MTETKDTEPGHPVVTFGDGDTQIARLVQEIADLKAERDMWRESYHGTDHAKEQAEWQQERDAMVAKSEAEAAELAQVRSRLTTVEQALCRVEWCDTDGYRAVCPVCGARSSDSSHKPGCVVGAALTPTSPQTPEDLT